MDNKTSAINIQVDSDVKKEATLVLTDLGLINEFCNKFIFKTSSKKEWYSI